MNIHKDSISYINKSSIVPRSPMAYIKSGAYGDCMAVLSYRLLGIEVNPTDRLVTIDKSLIQAGTACIKIGEKVIPLHPHWGWYFYNFFDAFFPDGNLQMMAIPYCVEFRAPGEWSFIRGKLVCRSINEDGFILYNISDDTLKINLENGETDVEIISSGRVTLRLTDGNLVFSVSNLNPEFWEITQDSIYTVNAVPGGFSVTLPYGMQRTNNYEDPDGNLDYRTTTTLYLQNLTLAPR